MLAPVAIEFRVTGHGSADLEIRIGARSFIAGGISYTTDAVGDLLRCAIMIATGASNATVSFDREPAEWRLQLHSLLDPATGLGPVQIRLLEFNDFNAAEPDAKGVVAFVADCGALEFARAILAMADGVKDAGERFASFGAFPSTAYKSLKAALGS